MGTLTPLTAILELNQVNDGAQLAIITSALVSTCDYEFKSGGLSLKGGQSLHLLFPHN